MVCTGIVITDGKVSNTVMSSLWYVLVLMVHIWYPIFIMAHAESLSWAHSDLQQWSLEKVEEFVTLLQHELSEQQQLSVKKRDIDVFLHIFKVKNIKNYKLTISYIRFYHHLS